MALVLDTGIVYAYYDRSDDWHDRARDVITTTSDGLLLPAPVIPEVDHLLRHRLGAIASRTFYRGLIDGSYLVVDVPRDGYARIAAIAERHDELGFVDAAVVVIAEARRVRRIATSDRRHFVPLARSLSLELVP